MTKPLGPHYPGREAESEREPDTPKGPDPVAAIPQLPVAQRVDALIGDADLQPADAPPAPAEPDAPSPNQPLKKTSIVVPGMLEMPLHALEIALQKVGQKIPELMSSLFILQLTIGTAARTPDELKNQSEAITKREDKCCDGIIDVLEACHLLITTYRDDALNLMRYMPDEGADPNLAAWKKWINSLIPSGGTKRVVNSALGTGSFLAGMGAGVATVGPVLYSACEPLFVMTNQLPLRLDLVGWGAIYLFIVSIPTAISSIITAGLGTYAYGGFTLAWDKLFCTEKDSIREWRQKLNASFANAKEQLLAALNALEDMMRKLEELRATLPARCTDARAECADRAKQGNVDIETWRREDAAFVEQLGASEKSTRQEKILHKLFEMLHEVTAVVQPMDPLSAKDLRTRGFQGLADICRLLERLGKTHFFFPNGRPGKTSPKKRWLYDLLGFAAGPTAALGAFLLALGIDGERPVRMLHAFIVGVILDQAKTKKRDGVGMSELASAAFDPDVLAEQGLIHWGSRGVAELGLAIQAKTLPIIERANERRQFSPEKARDDVAKKMPDSQWNKHAMKSTKVKVEGLIGDAASVMKNVITGGLRRFLVHDRQRLADDEIEHRNEGVSVQKSLAEEYADMNRSASLTIAELRDQIRKETKLLEPDDERGVERIMRLIDYWEKRIKLEDTQTAQLHSGHELQMYDIHPLISTVLGRMTPSKPEKIGKKLRLGKVVKKIDLRRSVESMLNNINAGLADDAKMHRPSVTAFPGKDTILGTGPDGSLLVLERKFPADADEAPAGPKPMQAPMVRLIPPAEAQAFIAGHVAERESLPAVCINDEPSVQLLAEYAVGGGPLTPAQRDTIQRVLLNRDNGTAMQRLHSLFTKAQLDGFRGPDESIVVPGLLSLLPLLRKRKKEAWES